MSVILCWGEVDWSSEQEISLKRNQEHKMKLLVGANDVRELAFHWTLFVDGGLVFLAKYDSFNHQMILFDDYKKNAFRINLSKEGKRGIVSPYVTVFFEKYDEKTQSVTFKIAVYGDVFVQ
ncbi:hypothetical protein [Helicobacter kayseriensis]|uniref:hypothetical protein n=1 Tax=Helicobacter kayseriensis TaxID=2905877 RepID=UPI001E348849|nr:hypothetical protein [Helicobacter kayseriensis]MCE3046823.1 hypothetical protein [Helicobacter kayseriensis]MCE3047875.1 hypothetical protein [Helicobacter kayseriensis]